MPKKRRILFLSTGNCTRGAIAEGFLRALAGEHFQGVSTGIHANDVHPLAVDVMKEVGIDIADQRPKTVTESLRDQFGYAVILYDPAKERSPIFPFAPRLFRWAVPDPAKAEGVAENAEAFRRTRDEIRARVFDFVNETIWASQQEPTIAATRDESRTPDAVLQRAAERPVVSGLGGSAPALQLKHA